MTYKTLYSSAAKTDLKEAVLYISNELKNPTSANALLDAVNEELNTLSLFPYAHNIIANKSLPPVEALAFNTIAVPIPTIIPP